MLSALLVEEKISVPYLYKGRLEQMTAESTESIRIGLAMIKRMQAIQKSVEAAGRPTPTYFEIIKVWEQYTESEIVIATLIELLKPPSDEQIKKAIANAKARSAKRRT